MSESKANTRYDVECDETYNPPYAMVCQRTVWPDGIEDSRRIVLIEASPYLPLEHARMFAECAAAAFRADNSLPINFKGESKEPTP